MPNSRMANAGLSGLQRRPCGIIRIAALCVLCRYRHNGHWSRRAAPARARSLRHVRLEDVRLRRAGRRDDAAPLSAPRSASCRRCATPTISAPGSRCCARTTAPSSAPPRRRARPPTFSSPFFLGTTRGPPPQTGGRPRDALPSRSVSRPSRKAGFVRMRISGSAGPRRSRGRGLRRSS